MFGSIRNLENSNNVPNAGLQDVAGITSNSQQRNINSDSTSLTWETRIQCFIGCFILSVISSLCAGYLLLLTKISGFCIMSSIGAVLSLCSTCFLMGPAQQCKKMFDRNRWLASLFYIISIAMALVAGIILDNAPLALICIAGQYIAMTWYSLSYIPYAREAIRQLVGSCC